MYGGPEATIRTTVDGLGPGITVVIPVQPGPDRLRPTLASLARQTLDPAMMEIIVVGSDLRGDRVACIDEFRRDEPSRTLQEIDLGDNPGIAHVWSAGISAATRELITIVDAGDVLSETLLAALTAHADSRSLVACEINFDGAGAAHRAGRFPDGIAIGRGVAAPAHALTDIEPEPGLGELAEVLFWADVQIHLGTDIQYCPPAEGAVYFRHAGEPSDRSFDAGVEQRLDLVGRLERLAERSDGDRALAVVRDRIGVQADAIGAYLREHPDRHAEFVRAADRRPVFHLPYDRVNVARPAGLAIAYAFPPYSDTSALVAAKRLRARGETVDVISNAMDSIRRLDHGTRRIAGPFVRRLAALRTPSYFSAWSSMEQFATAGMAVINEWETDGGPYAWIYSRAHFTASHILAALYKLSRPEATWHAEFSDPLSRDVAGAPRRETVRRGATLRALAAGLRDRGLPLPRSRSPFVWAEEVTYLLADQLTFTNENQLDYMLGFCSDPRTRAIAARKATIVPQPTLPDAFYSMVDVDYPLADDLVNIAYFGNFYANRGLDDVLQAAARLTPERRERLRIHIFTGSPDVIGRRTVELNISDIVCANPYVPFLDFLRLTTRFSCLVVNDSHTRDTHPNNPFLPSKLADYRGSGAPIWGLTEPHSPMSRQPLDFASPIGDVHAAERQLDQIVKLGLERAR